MENSPNELIYQAKEISRQNVESVNCFLLDAQDKIQIKNEHKKQNKKQNKDNKTKQNIQCFIEFRGKRKEVWLIGLRSRTIYHLQSFQAANSFSK